MERFEKFKDRWLTNLVTEMAEPGAAMWPTIPWHRNISAVNKFAKTLYDASVPSVMDRFTTTSIEPQQIDDLITALPKLSCSRGKAYYFGCELCHGDGRRIIVTS